MTRLNKIIQTTTRLPGGSDGKESACSARDLDFIPGSERSLGEGKGNPLPCLENCMDRGAWWVTESSHGDAESDTTEWLHFHFFGQKQQKEYLWCYFINIKF